MNPAQQKTLRIEMVDALRGFALLAILLVHCLEHFIYPVYPNLDLQPAWLNTLDATLSSAVFSLFAGKAYAIFALLFGFSYFVQYNNQKKAGSDFSWRFAWRLILLAAFGVIDAAFFPGGDVLLLFAIVGLVLILVRKWSDKAILWLAIILLLQPIEWFHYIASLVNPAYALPDLGVAAMYEQLATYTQEGNWGQFLLANITLGQKASLLWAVEQGRIWQTTGLFLAGFLLGRKQLLMSSQNTLKFWTRGLIIAAVAFGILCGWEAAIPAGTVAADTVGVVLTMWGHLAFMVVLIAGFVILYQLRPFRWSLRFLHYYGRMSLSNYIGQAVLAALVFFPIGLNLAPYCGATLSLFVGVLIGCAQILYCRIRIRRYRRGILESLWSRLTWLGKR